MISCTHYPYLARVCWKSKDSRNFYRTEDNEGCIFHIALAFQEGEGPVEQQVRTGHVPKKLLLIESNCPSSTMMYEPLTANSPLKKLFSPPKVLFSFFIPRNLSDAC